MSNSNCKSHALKQPVISSFVGQTIITHMSPVLTNKDNIQQKDTIISSFKRSNEDNSLMEGNVSKKTNTKATPPKTSQLKLNKEDLGMDILHKIQLMKNDMNKNHAEINVKVDSNITVQKSVQSSLSNLIGFPARV